LSQLPCPDRRARESGFQASLTAHMFYTLLHTTAIALAGFPSRDRKP
jgi:hypothetical protein